MGVFDKLNPEALKAAMRTGTDHWGRWGSIEHHAKYLQPALNKRRRCWCGCKRAGTHVGFVNGVAMTAPFCELAGQRWLRDRPIKIATPLLPFGENTHG